MAAVRGRPPACWNVPELNVPERPIVDKLFGWFTYPTPTKGRTRAIFVITPVEFWYDVAVITPLWLVLAVPVAVVAIAKTVELGTSATVANVRLKAAVANPVIEIFLAFAKIPCAAAVV